MMTNEEAIEVLRTIEVCGFKDKSKKYFFKDVTDALGLAIKALEQISHLKNRPCEVCEFYTGDGCSKWECVFKEVKADDDKYIRNRI